MTNRDNLTSLVLHTPHLSVQSAFLGFMAMTIWINQLEQNVNLEFVLLNVV